MHFMILDAIPSAMSGQLSIEPESTFHLNGPTISINIFRLLPFLHAYVLMAWQPVRQTAAASRTVACQGHHGSLRRGHVGRPPNLDML